MNAETLLRHFNIVSEATGAIEEFRQFILDLAINGRLVAQEPTDESALSLLSRIEITRADLIARKRIRPAKAEYGPLSAGDCATLPNGWVKTTLGTTCDLQTGATPSRDRPEYFGGDVRWLVSGDINQREIYDCNGRITEVGMRNSNCKILPAGCVLIALNGQGKTRGSVALLRVPATCNQSLVAVIPFRSDCLTPEFLYWNLRARYQAIRNLTGDDDRRGLNMKLIACFEISIPPLNEQYRIVEKISELMAMCDELEAAREQREAQRDRFVLGAVKSLLADGHESGDHVGARIPLVFDHFRRLTASERHIQAVRTAIIDIAIRGKLVPQRVEDESASLLLNRAQEAKMKGQKTRGRNSQGGNGSLPLTGAPFSLPQNWSWATCGELALEFRYGTAQKCEYDQSGVPVLRIPNVRGGRISTDDLKFAPLSSADVESLSLAFGDILLIRSNGSLNLVGRAALVEEHVQGFCYAGYLVRMRLVPQVADPRYVVLAMSSTFVREQIERPIRSTVGLKNINSTEFGRLLLPLPPLAEQRRIVEVVDDLAAICDDLRDKIREIAGTRTQLLNLLVRETLGLNLNHSLAETATTQEFSPAVVPV